MSSGILPMPDSCAGITEAEHWSAPVLLFISIFFGRATTDRAGARPLWRLFKQQLLPLRASAG
jgi:hypothetical protein